ncbi:hypothetical protein MRB53_027110 [Persea americana]|uniref:Uncharacterized protein n=1 Tax=Persea americana TaxID=3435 RepID=A0ACC2LK35_PERAE|nr:hypothetical protein MRB53_027110 [Persea americana]|eukprot:TRINITY_DN8366_c0_g1_i2.p1 TRINITY_DN8366_c0_g1~~TRINITY_DN8366_c0_g1_i2.p1  ORF type:complete len:154 (-),score=23.78 TRINITY_DN8366_c0_g1_i2:332-793(-)
MGFFKRIAGLLGFVRDENHETTNEDRDEAGNDRAEQEEPRHRGPTKGFSVQVPATVDRTAPNLGPVLLPCNPAQGGVQGLKWYAKRVRVDEDGDVADEFLDEILPETSGQDDHRPMPKFQVKYSTRPVKVRDQMVTPGNIHQNVEFKGRLQWV